MIPTFGVLLCLDSAGGAIVCAQALHLGESREVAQDQHAKGPLTRSLAFRFAQQKMESLLAGLGKLRAGGGAAIFLKVTGMLVDN